ncbi:MAG: hypothetical protein M3O70_02250, partial [Actinomycetota bacterium]|nr:hypothetical protein [Actinomycetota bacterium]
MTGTEAARHWSELSWRVRTTLIAARRCPARQRQTDDLGCQQPVLRDQTVADIELPCSEQVWQRRFATRLAFDQECPRPLDPVQTDPHPGRVSFRFKAGQQPLGQGEVAPLDGDPRAARGRPHHA